MVSCAAALQRADWGEQPLWACVTLAAMLGQIGLPGGGYTIGYAVNAHIGNIARPFRPPPLPQGENPVEPFIPVASISEMLLNPGASYHHQDLNRLRNAFKRPDTVIVNEINWTSTARHADIVLPVAASQERTDFGAGRTDNILVPMPRSAETPGEARVEYDIFTELAARMGTEEAFTEGRDADGWLRQLWSETISSSSRTRALSRCSSQNFGPTRTRTRVRHRADV